MRFTSRQYDKAIKSLQEAREQLEPDGRNCTCCGDSGHQAFECGFNPLVAMAICRQLADEAHTFHEQLHAGQIADVEEKVHEVTHWLAGHITCMGEMVGPAKVRLPS